MHGIISLNLLMQKSICVPGNSAFRNVATFNPYSEMYMVVLVILVLICERTEKLSLPKVGHLVSEGPWI